jgi:hypothetical protein
MGLLGKVFRRVRRKKKDEEEAAAPVINPSQQLISDVTELVTDERKRFKELQAKQLEDARAYQERKLNMQGGGRRGLMYGANARGVA